MFETIDSYVPTDQFFAAAFIDSDEWRDSPYLHRYVHGGFEGTGTRFSFYFPLADAYHGRFLQFLEGGAGGDERACSGPMGIVNGGLQHSRDCGAYLVESNQGHMGGAPCPKADRDATVYSYRASAESARLARHLATEIYGSRPHHGYVFGPSGGAVRSLWCMENVEDVWDGALPMKMGNGGVSFGLLATLCNVRRVLGDQLAQVIDATDVGSDTDRFAGLTSQQRGELAMLYRVGFPRGAERAISGLNFALALWALEGANAVQAEPGYFKDFWHSRGHLGSDEPQTLEPYVIDATATVSQVVTAGELAQNSRHPLAAMISGWVDPSTPLGVVLDEQLGASTDGAELRVLTGGASGARHICVMDVDGVITVSPLPTIGNDFLGFEGLTAGDTIAVDNRSFLAFCHYARHHVSSAPEFDTYRLDGATIYPQHPAQSLSALFGGPYHDREYTGSFHGKVIVLQHTLDSTAWPSAAVGYAVLAEKELGDQLDERFRLWWIDHAEHYDASHVPPGPVPVATTRLLDTHGLVGQGLRDLIAWVEDATPPAPSTGAEYDEQGHLRLARTAGERGGIQPLVAATANGGLRAEVAPGDVVSFRVSAECPPGSGRITRLEWDFEGGGVWADLPLDTTASESLVEREVLHTFHAPGTYFCSVRATAHRDGDPETDSRLLTNLARVRVVVS